MEMERTHGLRKDRRFANHLWCPHHDRPLMLDTSKLNKYEVLTETKVEYQNRKEI